MKENEFLLLIDDEFEKRAQNVKTKAAFIQMEKCKDSGAQAAGSIWPFRGNWSLSVDDYVAGLESASLSVTQTRESVCQQEIFKLINLLDGHSLQLISPVYYQWTNTEEEINVA